MAKQPEALTKFKRHMYHAERLLKESVERYAEVDDKIGLREGHKKEMRRRVVLFRDTCDWALAILEGRIPPDTEPPR